MLTKPVKLTMTLAVLALAAGIFTPQARAESANATWVGPNGGTVRWHGRGEPGRYRGTVVVETPDGRVYRRVTTVRRGAYGAYARRTWSGPNGVVYRSGAARY